MIKKTFPIIFILLSFCGQEDSFLDSNQSETLPTENLKTENLQTTTTAVEVVQLDTFENIPYYIIKDQSKVGYLAPKQFLNSGLETVEGTTNEIVGKFTLTLSECDQADSCLYITDLAIKVDISSLKSNNSIRDRAIKNQWLESILFPDAVFTIEELVIPNKDFDSKVEDTIIGKLTIRDIELSTPFSITAFLDSGLIFISGFTEIDTTWFGFAAPTKFNAWEVLNPIGIKVDLVAGQTD